MLCCVEISGFYSVPPSLFGANQGNFAHLPVDVQLRVAVPRNLADLRRRLLTILALHSTEASGPGY